MGGISVGRGEELVETVFWEGIGRRYDRDFNGQAAKPWATGEHQEGWDRIHTTPQVGEPFTHEITSGKSLVIESFRHAQIVSLAERVGRHGPI